MIKILLIKIFGEIDYQFYVSEIIELIKKMLWPITALIIIHIFKTEISKLIGRIKNIKYKNISVEMSPSYPEVESKLPVEKKLPSRPKANQKAIYELVSLLSNYKFVWSAWTESPKYSHAVRFSEKYAGGKLRYIDQFCSDLKNYDKKYANDLPKDIKSKLDDLRAYLESVLPYHEEHQELTAPAFSRPMYIELFGNLINIVNNATSD